MLPVERGTFKMGIRDEMIEVGFVVEYKGDTTTIMDKKDQFLRLCLKVVGLAKQK